MSISEAQKRASKKYLKTHNKQIKLSMPIHEAKALERYCKKQNVTKMGLIRSLIRAEIERDFGREHRDFELWISEKWHEAKAEGIVTQEQENELSNNNRRREDIENAIPYLHALMRAGYISLDEDGYFKTTSIRDTPEELAEKHKTSSGMFFVLR